MPKGTYSLPKAYQGIETEESGIPKGMPYRSDCIPADSREIPELLRVQREGIVHDPDYKQLTIDDNGTTFSAINRLKMGKINLDWIVRNTEGIVEELSERSSEISRLKNINGRN